MYEKVWEYLESNMQYTMPKERQKHHDVILQDYMVEHNIPWTVSVPTLVEHIGVVSTMKHQVGKSILYMNDVIAKDQSQEKSQDT